MIIIVIFQISQYQTLNKELLTRLFIGYLPENIAWQTHRPEARGPVKSGTWGGRPTCHPKTPPLGSTNEVWNLQLALWRLRRFRSSWGWSVVDLPASPPFRRPLLLPLSGTKYCSWAAWTVNSEAVNSSEMSPTIYQTTRCHIAEDLDPHRNQRSGFVL